MQSFFSAIGGACLRVALAVPDLYCALIVCALCLPLALSAGCALDSGPGCCVDCPDCHCDPCNCCDPVELRAARPAIGVADSFAIAPITESQFFAFPTACDPLNEPKFGCGPCLTCRPSRPVVVMPANRPTATPHQAKPDPLNESKTGSYLCQCCRHAKTGVLFHTSWTADGRPVTYLCDECWHRLSPPERMQQFNAWIAGQSIAPLAVDSLAGAVRSDL